MKRNTFMPADVTLVRFKKSLSFYCASFKKLFLHVEFFAADLPG